MPVWDPTENSIIQSTPNALLVGHKFPQEVDKAYINAFVFHCLCFRTKCVISSCWQGSFLFILEKIRSANGWTSGQVALKTRLRIREQVWKEKSSAVVGDIHSSASNSRVLIWTEWQLCLVQRDLWEDGSRCWRQLAPSALSLPPLTNSSGCEAHSTGQSMDPLPRHLALSMQDENSKAYGLCVCLCSSVSCIVKCTYWTWWNYSILVDPSVHPVGNKTKLPLKVTQELSAIPIYLEVLLIAFHMQNVHTHKHTISKGMTHKLRSL